MNKYILKHSQKIATCVFLALSAASTPCFAKEGSQPQTQEAPKTAISWITNYNQAIEQAKKESKPLFVYFTGSDWCSWCYKMDDEILTNADFIHSLKNQFVFVKIDFPIYKTLDATLTKQNEELKEKFHIQGFPTILLLDTKQNTIAHLNYREGGAKAYADYIQKILAEHKEFQKNVKNLSQQSSASLQQLYKKAERLGMDEEMKIILKQGLCSKDNTFFLKEHYKNLLGDGKMNALATRAVRKELLDKDPENKKHVHYDVAILEFETLCKNLPALKNADSVLKPLEQYLAQYGQKDSKNRWKLEMTISQVYRSKNQIDKASQFAKLAQNHAPAYMRLDIAKLVTDLQNDSSAIAEASDDE